MKVSRIDLADIGSPRRLASTIHEIEDLPLAVPINELCSALDIQSIEEIGTQAFEGALITDELRSAGHILINKHSPPRRRRFSIAHELGHFLIEAHQPDSSGRIECSLHDLHRHDPRSRDRRFRMEAEANLFAADLLMPPKKIRSEVGRLGVSMQTLVKISRSFDVSKEAIGRAFVVAHRDPVAIVISREGRVQRFYKHEDFPFLPLARHKALPLECVSTDPMDVGVVSDVEEVDPETWLGERDAQSILCLTEQVLGQRDGYAMTLLQTELDDTE